MKITMKFAIWCGIFYLFIGIVQGSAFSIFEQGNKASAMGGAFTATADDPSAIFYNVAGLAFMSHDQLYVGGNLLFTSGSFSGSDPVPGANIKEKMARRSTVLPNVYYIRPINEKFTAGIGLFTPYGLSTEWQAPEKFTGRFFAQRASISCFSINPAIAFHLNDELGIGAGLEIRESKVILERDLPFLVQPMNAIFDIAHLTMESKRKFSISFNVGMIFKFMNNYQIGVSYHHKIKARYSGKAEFAIIPLSIVPGDQIPGVDLPEGNVAVNTSLNYPSTLSVGFAYKVNEGLNVEFDVNWVKWSDVKELLIEFPDNPIFNIQIDENYKNAMNLRLGLEKKLGTNLFGRAGYYYDKSPVPPQSIDPIIPDSGRHGVSVGLGILKGSMNLELYNLIIFFQKGDTQGISRFNYNGVYKKFADIMGVALTYKW